MRSYRCFYRRIGKEKWQEWSASLCDVDWGGDGDGRGGIVAVGAGNDHGDIWLSEKTQGPLVYVANAKSPEASSRSSHKIKDGRYTRLLLLLSRKEQIAKVEI